MVLNVCDDDVDYLTLVSVHIVCYDDTFNIFVVAHCLMMLVV